MGRSGDHDDKGKNIHKDPAKGNEETMQYDIPLLNKEFHDINPFICGWHYCDRGHSFGPAIREYYLIHYILTGKGCFERAGTTYNLTHGNLFLIRPRELTFYKADMETPWNYVWIGFHGALASKLIEETYFNNNPTIYSPGCESIFKDMMRAEKMNQTAELYLCGKIFELFAFLKEMMSEKNQQSLNYAQRAEHYIQSNYMNKLSITGIAKMLGIDRRYLFRVFTEYTGMSPMQYLVNYKLEKAAQLLMQCDVTVSEAARSCGYSDTFNFSKMFKKKHGVSPSGYKKNLKV